MATPVNVNGKIVTRPGVYSYILSGVTNPPLQLSYGNVCIIDTGLGAGWGGGAGINGQLASGPKAVNKFTDIKNFRSFVKGGKLWLNAQPLFLPGGSGKQINGVSTVYLIRAATTTTAEIDFTVANGSFAFQTLDEGLNANGVLTTGQLSNGYACTLIPGVQDTSKFIIQFFLGGFVGNDPMNGNIPYNSITAANSTPQLIVQSDEVATIADLVAWAASSYDFQQHFKLKSGTVESNAVAATSGLTLTGVGSTGNSIDILDPLTGDSILDGEPVTQTSGITTVTQLAAAIVSSINSATNINGGYTATNAAGVVTITSPLTVAGLLNTKELTIVITGTIAKTQTAFSGGISTGANFTAADITTYIGYTLATGGTETYTAADFDLALEQAKTLDNTFFLSTDYGATGNSLSNTKILDYIQNDAKYEKFIVIGGGFDSTEYLGGTGSSTALAKHWNSDKVIVPHGGVLKAAKLGGFNTYDQFYKASLITGRICGLEPQTPVTLKNLDIDGEVHQLSETEQEYALATGIFYTYYDIELANFVAGEDINTLQNNEFLVNDDGTSFSIAVKRICSQVNKLIIYTAKQVFFGKNVGPNRNTVTPSDIRQWLEGFLQSITANTNQDNLIISFSNINVTVSGDNYYVSYNFVPNFEISKIIFAGFILES